MLQPVRKVNLPNLVVERIKDLIADGQLKPGNQLPAERQLTQELGVGRSTIREAVRILEALGIVEVRPGHGTFVREKTEDITDTPLSTWLLLHREDLLEHFEVRQVIEPGAAYLAAQRATREDIQAMHKTVEEMKAKINKGDLAGVILADSNFHHKVSKATHNRTLMYLMDTFVKHLKEGWKASLRIPDRAQKSIPEHEEILHAIEKGKPEAARQAMEQHLSNALEDLKREGLFDHSGVE